MAKADLNFTLLIEKTVSQIETHYDELITKLSFRRDNILQALRVLADHYREKNKVSIKSIANLDQMIDTSSVLFKNNNSLDVNVRTGHVKMYTEQKEEIWSRMEKSSVKFVNNICIDDCVRVSGFIQIEGLSNIEHLQLDSDLFVHDKRKEFEETAVLNESMVLDDSLAQSTQISPTSPDYLLSYDEVNSHSPCSSLPASICREHNFLLTSPSAISIDPDTHCVYALDGGKANRIVVFTSEGEGKEEIYPLLPKKIRGHVALYGICVRKCKIYLSDIQNNAIIAIQEKGGDFIASTPGKSFNSIQNLAVDPENGQVFACDKNSMKIRVFDELLLAKYQFGERFLSGPRDVKIRKDKVIVLDSGDYSLCYFSKAGILLGHSITFFSSYTPFLGGIFFSDKARVQFFDIDEEGNSYITNFHSPSIHRFDMYGGYQSHLGNEDIKNGPHTKGIAVIDGKKVLSICTNRTQKQLQFLYPNN